MAESKVVSVRVADELLLWLEEFSEQQYPLKGKDGGNKSQVILDALLAYRDSVNSVDKTVNSVDIAEVHSIVSEAIAPLQQQIEQLKSDLGEFAA